MDVVFILIIAALYASTHWLVWALSRLGGPARHDGPAALPSSLALRGQSAGAVE